MLGAWCPKSLAGRRAAGRHRPRDGGEPGRGGDQRSPPTLGVGRRILEEKAVNAFLYKTRLVEDLIDGKPEAVRAALRQNLVSWSPPGSPAVDVLLDHLTENHSGPGEFVASAMWFRYPEGNPITFYANETKPAGGQVLEEHRPEARGPVRIRRARR